jgi:hypothetical protein
MPEDFRQRRDHINSRTVVRVLEGSQACGCEVLKVGQKATADDIAKLVAETSSGPKF